MGRVCVALAFLTCAIHVTVAQQPPAAPNPAPTFDVVSIKRNMVGFSVDTTRVEGGRYTVLNKTVSQIVGDAYRLRPDQVVGGPDWIKDPPGPPAAGEFRYDIVATIPPGTSPAQIPLMMQRVLAERFHLVAHIGKEERPTYALVLAREDRRLGPKLTRSTQECQTEIEGGSLRAPVRRTTEDGKPVCSMMIGRAIIGGGLTMRFLANALSTPSGRTVVDHTGLEGTFDFEVRYRLTTVPTSGQDDQPTVFVAVQEQLGLKLEPRVEPVDVLVIDSVAMPTEN